MTPAELVAWRTDHRLSLTQLGQALGVHRQTVFAWEHGRQSIPPYLAMALETLAARPTPAPSPEGDQS